MPSLDPAVQPTSTLPAPPGHELQHASSIGARSPRTGDSFHYPECRPQSPLLAGASTPRTSLQHDYPPPVPGDGHKKRASMAPIPSVALLSSVPGGVHGLPISEDHELSDKDRLKLSRFHRFPLPADDESHAGLKLTDLEPAQQQVVRDVLELMCARPTKEIIERTFAKDCVYEDPNLKCVGRNELAAQWFLLAKCFPHTRTLSFILLKPTATVLRWEMVQEYTWAIGTTRLVHSLVQLELDAEGKVKHMVDRWDGKELEQRMTDPQPLKRLHAKVTRAMTKVP